MSVDQQIYGSADWHLPSPSSTPKSVTHPDSCFKTPKSEGPHSHFFDAWSTPRVNGHQTPAQTPSFAVSSPVDRPSSSYSQKIRTPEDPAFHVHHFAATNLPLPPVEPSQRLSSSPGPFSARRNESTLRQNPPLRPRPVSMDPSQMQTPPPTRDASSRRSAQQQARNDVATPATVIARSPGQGQPNDGPFHGTPFGFPSLQFSPDMGQFPSTGPLSAPALPQSRLFWDQPNDGNNMDVDMAMASDPFGSTSQSHQTEGGLWGNFNASATQMNPQAFQALHGMSSPGFGASYATSNGDSRPASYISTSMGVDPSMLFSFSSPGPTAATFGYPTQQPTEQGDRQPYGQQLRDSLKEREEMAMRAKSQHSRTNTSSSSASYENARPAVQRSNTDTGLRKSSRPSSMESRTSSSAAGYIIPRRSSPLKRQSGGSLTSIPEIRRPRTRLVIDENGRARTETVAEDDNTSRMNTRRDSQELRRQYPGLWAEEDSESDSDEPPATSSRNASFAIPPSRGSKHARNDSNGLERSNSFKVPRPSSGFFDKSSFETIRPVKKSADNSYRRFSMMDFPSSFDKFTGNEEQDMADCRGDALGALKKVVEGRQKRIDRSSQNTLKAHNQRWAQVSAELGSSTSPHQTYDPYSNSFSGSPATNTDAGFTTPSTDRSSLSSDSTRCICNIADDGRPMVQCESCNKWLHMTCVGLHSQNLPPVYVCIFCTGQTPVARGGRVRGPLPTASTYDSPLTHKSVFRR